MTSATILEFKGTDGRPLQAPHNIEAEQALLGAIFMNNEAFYRASEFLAAEHFFEPVHRDIYDTITKLIRVGKAATPITVKTYLPEQLTPEMPMSRYLARLAVSATTVVNAGDFARIIHDAAIDRGLIAIGQGMAGASYQPDPDVTSAMKIEAAERALYELAERGTTSKGIQQFSSALNAAIAMAAEAYQRDGTLSGISTGLVDLDRMMGGLQKSDLIILAGRPAMGKTALATNIGFHVARAFRAQPQDDGRLKTIDGGQVVFFSLEMSAEQLATRIVASEAEISSSDIRRGRIHESQFTRLVETANAVNAIPLYIDDSGGLSVHQLAARARRLKRQKGLDLIIIDYIQLLTGSDRRRDNRVQEVTEITTTLKALAKELEVPVIALSQLNRAVESRDDKHPQLADLRESGSIEQDADVVLFVYREEYYLRNSEPKEGTPEHITWQQAMEKVHGRAEVIIGKQRHGPTGTAQLSFTDRFTRFGNLDRSSYMPAGDIDG
ncbi:MAG: replicative DNA helicase [Devosia sp.]